MFSKDTKAIQNGNDDMKPFSRKVIGDQNRQLDGNESNVFGKKNERASL